MAISRHPGSSPVLARDFTGEADSRIVVSPDAPETVSPADSHPELGPRSLHPAALFGARVWSLFETGRRLPTSATAFRHAGYEPELWILAGTEASTSFLFLRTTPSLAGAVMRGEPRSARSPSPGVGSSCLRRFARPRYRVERPTFQCFAPEA
jgi:hypothetical protein